MRDLYGFLSCLALGIILQCYFPWWSLAFAGMPASLFFYSTSQRSFWMSFAAIVIPWIMIPLFIDFSNQHILSERIQSLFMDIPSFAIQTLIAVLVGSFCGVAAQFTFLLIKQFKA
jgi:hypothetical protein